MSFIDGLHTPPVGPVDVSGVSPFLAARDRLWLMEAEQAVNPTEEPARPGLAALFSALIPGAGQLYAGRVLRALVVAAPLLILIAAMVVVASDGAVGVLELAVRPVVIWSALGVNIAILAWRLFAVVDAYRVAGGSSPGMWSLVVLGVLAAFVVIPHVAIGAYGFRGALFIDRGLRFGRRRERRTRNPGTTLT